MTPPDWNARKRAIGTAFLNAPYLPADPDELTYRDVFAALPIHDQRDLAILVSILRDAIMQAKRDERPITPLQGFLVWVLHYQSKG